jgi:hypothetical protein
MVWHSEEIMNNYYLINKLVNNALKLRNDPKREEFKSRKVDIIMCVDFTKKSDVNIGVFAMDTINNAFSMMRISNFTELNKNIYLGEFHLNKTKYCKNYIPSWCVD